MCELNPKHSAKYLLEAWTAHGEKDEFEKTVAETLLNFEVESNASGKVRYHIHDLPEENSQLTVSLQEYLEDYLGDLHFRPIRPHVALAIEAKMKGKLVIYIQWSDFEGQALETPIIWWYKYWAESHERWKQGKIRSENERIERFIFEANVKIVTKQIMLVACMDWASATRAASRMLREKQMLKIKAFGVEKLVTKKEEL